MTEYTNNTNSPACGQWEVLLADALDGLLAPEDEKAFAAHKLICPACASLFEEAKRGRAWLEYLADEPEVPAGLLDRLLAKTGPGQMAGDSLTTEGNVLQMPPVAVMAGKNRRSVAPAWQRPGLMAHVYRYAEPRLLMTAAMAFFSIALTMNLTGVRLGSLHLADLRPSMVRSMLERQLTTASTPVIRYYDHSRFVNEVSERMRDLRRATQGEGQPDDGSKQQQKNALPGETRTSPGKQDGAPQAQPPQQSAKPANSNDFLESSLTSQERPAHSGGSAKEIRERSFLWTA
jgi:hypothetical protein